VKRSTGIALAAVACGAGLAGVLWTAWRPRAAAEPAPPEVEAERGNAVARPTGTPGSSEREAAEADDAKDAAERGSSGEPEADRASSAAARAEFREMYGGDRLPSVEELTDPSFVRGQNSKLSTMEIVVRNLGLTAADLRTLYEEAGEDAKLRTCALLGVAYGSGLDGEDLAWLEGLATVQTDDPRPEELVAIHAARAASGINRLNDGDAMSRIVKGLLDGVVGEDGTAESSPALKLALQSMDELGEAVSVRELETLALREGTSEELAGQCLEALARTGGADGARAVMSAYRQGVPAALDAIASIHDATAIPELLDWVEAGAAGGESEELARAAMAGLFSTGQDVALETFERLARGDDSLSAEENERRRRIALEALAEADDPRSFGVLRQVLHLVDGWRFHDTRPELRPVGEAAHRAVSLPTPLTWMLPPGKVAREIAAGLRHATEALPPDSKWKAGGYYALARIARPEDVPFIEANTPAQNYDGIMRHMREVERNWK